jgi:hypothetical protein
MAKACRKLSPSPDLQSFAITPGAPLLPSLRKMKTRLPNNQMKKKMRPLPFLKERERKKNFISSLYVSFYVVLSLFFLLCFPSSFLFCLAHPFNLCFPFPIMLCFRPFPFKCNIKKKKMSWSDHA